MASAARATPSASAPAKASVGRTRSRRSRPPCHQASRARKANQQAVTTITWKLVSGWPPRNWMATTAASPATGSGPGLRITISVSSRMYGISGKTFVSGHGSHTTKKVPNAKTTPAKSAPPKRMPSTRASRNVPRAAMNSLSIAITASDFQSGRTKAGTEKGENTADCALAMYGRPAMMWGFQSGIPGS